MRYKATSHTKKKSFKKSIKKSVRLWATIISVQILIIIVFIRLINGSRPIELQNTGILTVCVEEKSKARIFKNRDLLVFSDSQTYIFTPNNAPLSQLDETISVGDHITVRYYESFHGLLGKTRRVVEAKKGSEILCTLDQYNEGKRGVVFITCAVFVIIELLFLGICSLYIILKR